MADTKDLIYKLEMNAVECESPKSDEAASATFLREWAMMEPTFQAEGLRQTYHPYSEKEL